MGTTPKVVYIRIKDHFKTDDPEETSCTLDIVGWLIKEDKDYMTLAQVSQDNGKVYSDFFHALKSCIIDKRDIC